MMSAGVEIKVISPNDTSIYARSANSRLISSDMQNSNPVSTSKVVQIASGKRRGYEAKNDPNGKKTSERRVSSHMPPYEDNEPTIPSMVFEAVVIPEEPSVVVIGPGSSVNEVIAPPDVTPLSPKLQSEYGKSMIQLNISPPIHRKAPSSRRRQASKAPPVVQSVAQKVEPVAQAVQSIVETIEPLIVETVSSQEIGVEEIAPKSSRRRGSAEKSTSRQRSSKRRVEPVKPIVETVIEDEQPVIEIMEEKPQSAPRPARVELNPDAPTSPRAERRPKSSPRKSNPKSSDKHRTRASPPSPTSGNVHYDNHSVISPEPIIDTQGNDRHSNRRADLAAKVKSDPRPLIKAVTTAEPKVAPISQPTKTTKSTKPAVAKRVEKPQPSPRPKSPHRVAHEQPTIRIGGRQVTSRDYVSTDSSSARENSRQFIENDEVEPPTPSDGSNSDTTTRRKIKSRQDGLDRGLKQELGNEEFCPEDDEHLDLAIKIALEESQKQSVQEALEAGHDLNAEVLKSLHRPNAIGEVIEKLVSQRRERIHEQQSSRKKKKAPVQQKSPAKSIPKQPIKKKVVEEIKASVDDAEEDDQPDIETAEEDDQVEEQMDGNEMEEEEIKPPSKKKTTSKRRVKTPAAQKSKQPIEAKAVATEPEAGLMEEENVKLPKATRDPRPSDDPHVQDILTGEKVMSRKDKKYDPNAMMDEPDDEDSESIGDDVYEESSEDDDRKMTINEKKDEMFYRFKLVKEAYPGISLPRITRKMKLAKMVRYYEHIMARIKLKVKTNNFKVFLIVGFLAMQFGGKKLGLNTDGFTVNQMTSMKRYERMLREFGESDWSSIGVSLPVTVRLPFFMLVNMGIFVISKWIFQKTKKDYSVQFHKLYAQLTGGDDYVFMKDETGDNGLGAGGGEQEEGGGGGIFGMLKPILSMFGGFGGGNGGGDEEAKPKRGEAEGPTYKRRSRKPAAE